MKTMGRITAMLFFALTIIIMPATVHAAAGISGWITSSRAYDLNSDGKKDTLRLTTTGSGSNKHYVVNVNGKKYKLANPGGTYTPNNGGIKVITLANGRSFIYTYVEGPNPGVTKTHFLRYTKSGITRIVDLTNMFSKFASKEGASVLSVSGNTVNVRYWIMSWTAGTLSLNMKFKYKSGKLVRSSAAGNMVGNQIRTTAKGIQAYTSWSGKKYAFTTSTGINICFLKYYLKGNNCFFSIQTNHGRIGWIRALQRQHTGRSPLFSDGWYVG